MHNTERTQTALIRVWNDKYDLTYLTSLYKEKDHDVTMRFAKQQCRRWMNDEFGATASETENVNVKFLFSFTYDGILHNDYFRKGKL